LDLLPRGEVKGEGREGEGEVFGYGMHGEELRKSGNGSSSSSGSGSSLVNSVLALHESR
jgi:hypothetical protein